MKNTLKTLFCALLAIGMFACGEKNLTLDDMREAQESLFNEDQTMNLKVAPKVAEKYCRFVSQHPDDPNAPALLFHVVEINMKLEKPEKCIKVGNQLVEQYPDSKWAPRCLFFLANFIYDGQLHDLDQARATYEKLINDYPDNELVESAKKSIEFLGLTPDEIMSIISLSQMEEEEGEF